MLVTPKAIFFDFDGVIVESAEIKTEAFLQIFSEYPQHLNAIKEYHLANMGVSRFKKFEWIYSNILGLPLIEEDKQRLGETFSEIVFDKVVQAPFVPGAQQLLNYVSGNCFTFVASGTPENELVLIVEQRNLTAYFDEVCGSPRTKIQIINELLEKYQLQPHECWFVGDADTDHHAAVNTGLNFIARSTPEMELYWQQLKNVWIVESMHEIFDHMNHG